jgi:hypothetical protein
MDLKGLLSHSLLSAAQAKQRVTAEMLRVVIVHLTPLLFPNSGKIWGDMHLEDLLNGGGSPSSHEGHSGCLRE